MKLISRTKKIPSDARWLCVADLHLHHLPSWRLDWCYDFADDLVAYLDETDLELVLLGDVLELKDKVDARVANILIYILTNASRVYWITGQHDSYKPGQATFYELGALDHVCVVDERVFARGDNVYLVPFARDREDYREMLEMVPDGAGVFTHVPIADALRGFGAELPDDVITAADFDRFSWVYSGDIHQHSRHGVFEYIGATSQRDWRDAGVQGCVGVVTESGKLTRVPVAHPVHRKISTRAELRKKPNGAEIVKIDGLDVSEDEIERLRDRENVLAVDWIPPPVEALVKKAGVDEPGDQNPKKLISEYLESIEVPDGHAPKTALRKYALEILKGIGR